MASEAAGRSVARDRAWAWAWASTWGLRRTRRNRRRSQCLVASEAAGRSVARDRASAWAWALTWGLHSQYRVVDLLREDPTGDLAFCGGFVDSMQSAKMKPVG